MRRVGVLGLAVALLLFGRASRAAATLCSGLTVNKTVSLNGTCPGSDPVDVLPGTHVTYCYSVTNNTTNTYDSHTLVDDQLGTLTVAPCTLGPSQSCTASASATITNSIANTAPWTAMTSGVPGGIVVGSPACGKDNAQVFVCGNGVVEEGEECDDDEALTTAPQRTALCCHCTIQYTDTCDDGDGVAPSTEDGAPNEGDGNDDGILDSLQSDVTSLPSATGHGYLTLITSGGCAQNQLVTAITEQAAGNDPNFDYPFGLIQFQLPCTSATVTVLYHGTNAAPGNVYRKYGSTPPTFDNPGFYTLPNVVFGTTVINGETVGSATFTLTDNQLGDSNPTIGLIFDPSGPAGTPANAAPALSIWVLSMVAVALTVFGVWSQRRRQAQT